MYYIHSDHLNTPKVVTDQNQQVVWKADYKPFGETEPTVTTLDMPLRFPGQTFDSETNLSYNYFRTYDTSTGRYGQNDPIGLSGGLNRYAYVKANPISRFDQYGLFDVVNPADYPHLDPGDGGVFCNGNGGFRVWAAWYSMRTCTSTIFIRRTNSRSVRARQRITVSLPVHRKNGFGPKESRIKRRSAVYKISWPRFSAITNVGQRYKTG